MTAVAKPKPAPQEVVLTRTIDAPREKVFRAWTNAKELAKWWGPKGFTNPRCEFDARPGGKIHIDMTGPDGVVYPMNGTVKEISPPAKLAFTSAALDDKGKPLFENLTTVTFTESGGKTQINVCARVIAIHDPALASEALNGMKEGWTQTLDRLEGYVEN